MKRSKTKRSGDYVALDREAQQAIHERAKRKGPVGTIGRRDFLTERANFHTRPAVRVLNQFLRFADRRGLYNNAAIDQVIEAGLRALGEWEEDGAERKESAA